MSSQYDRISHSFGKVEALSIRQHVELFSVFRALGPLDGECALDAGCGTGIYARQLKQQGAGRVVGLDTSKAMIEAARSEELRAPAGIEYVVGDVAAAGALGPFDVATAGYLFANATTTSELHAMSRGIYEALAPGGRFAATVLNDAFQSTDPTYYDRYGIALRHNGDLRDGSRVTVVISVGATEITMGAAPLERRVFPPVPVPVPVPVPDHPGKWSGNGNGNGNGSVVKEPHPITIESYYWTREAYESALTGAGFSEVRWAPIEVSPAGLEAHGKDAFSDYITHPHGLVIVGTKGGR